MLCPMCKIELRISDRQGVEIDYCPQCRGVWLDRGELDKILEREAATLPARERPPRRDDDRGDRYRDRDAGRYRDQYPRKRKGWLGELFEFGD